MVQNGSEGVTNTLARWVASLEPDALPKNVIHHTRRLLLDHLSAVIVGSSTEASQGVLSVAMETYGGDQATAVCGGRLSAGGAAFVNGSAAHGFEIDDGYTPGSVHPGAVVWPAVLAVAERYGLDWAQMMLGAAAGFELTCRIAAAGHPSTWRNGFHNTPIAGVFGAAAGVAALLSSDEETVANSFGIAGSHTGGLFAFLQEGGEVKRVHAGKAARDGLLSVELPRHGVTGPSNVFEAEKGYFSAFARGDWKPEALVGGLGTRWTMLNTYIKPYPCCRHLHGPIDAALALCELHHIGLADVDKVTVETYEVASHHKQKQIGTVLSAQMSIPYVIALTLRDHEVGIEQFSESARADQLVKSCVERVDVVMSPELDADYPRTRPAKVTIECADGRVLSSLVEQPLGEPSNPMSDTAVTHKVRNLCSPFVGSERTEALISQILQGDDVEHLMSGLANPPILQGAF